MICGFPPIPFWIVFIANQSVTTALGTARQTKTRDALLAYHEVLSRVRAGSVPLACALGV